MPSAAVLDVLHVHFGLVKSPMSTARHAGSQQASVWLTAKHDLIIYHVIKQKGPT
jgi:hypothetical protein